MPGPPRAAAEAAAADPQVLEGELLRTYDAFDANQGVGVEPLALLRGRPHRSYEAQRASGAPLLQFAGADGGPMIPMDSGAVVNGKLYAAHSNYNVELPRFGGQGLIRR